MPHELAAAFVRGAVRSSAPEPWKATVRFPAHRHHISYRPSASPADAAHHRRNVAASIPEHASGRRRSCSLTDDPRYRRVLTVAPSSGEKAWRQEGGAFLYLGSESSLYPAKSRRNLSCRALIDTTTELGRRKELPQLGRIVKISLLCLVLHKMGLLVPNGKNTDDKDKAGLNLAFLYLALSAGYIATKDSNKLATLLKICDVAMKLYKVSSEIVNLLFTLFK